MRRSPGISLLSLSLALSLSISSAGYAVVTEFANVFPNNNQAGGSANNRPFFDPAAFPGIPNPDGFSGTATPGVDSFSTVTGVDLGAANLGTPRLPDLSDNDGVPYGVTFTLESISFDMEALEGVFTDGGGNGLGIDTSALGDMTDFAGGMSGMFDASGNVIDDRNEQLLLDNIQVLTYTINDPLGRIASVNSTGGFFSVLRSNNFNESANGAVVSSDAAGTLDVKLFGTEDPDPEMDGPNAIDNNFNAGTLPNLSTAYITTTTNEWRLKGLGLTATADIELNAEPNRAIYDFASAGTNGESTTTLTENDLGITFTPVGDGATLGYSNFGIGVLSGAEPLVDPTDAELRVDGDASVPEALEIAFDRDVELETLLLGNVDTSETWTLSLVSGSDPFDGLTGYGEDFTIAPGSFSYTRPSGNGGLFFFFGDDEAGEDPILIEAGTVLSFSTSNTTGGGMLLQMLSASVIVEGLQGDFNGDGTVDIADYTVWRDNLGSTEGDLLSGNGTGGAIDGDDYDLWKSQFGNSLSASLSAAAVPEPATGWLAGVCSLLAVAFAYRARR